MDSRTCRERWDASRRPCHAGVTTTVLMIMVLAVATGTASAQKTDVITTRNGDEVTGEIVSLDIGRLEFKTDAMSTLNVKWPRVITVQTDKVFQIVLEDGTIHYGSLAPGVANSVVIQTAETTIKTPTQSIVRLQRLKPSFWRRLDGNIDLGFGFTQQNAKTSLSVGTEVTYPKQSNLTMISFDTRFSRQDGTEDILRLDGAVKHVRQYKERWFYLGFVSGARNSQLSLEHRVTVGGGLGRLLIESNKMGLGVWVAPGYARERFTGQSGSGSVPLALAAEFLLFLWEPRDTDISSRLAVLPILNEGGRWRLDFSLGITREVLKDFDIGVGITEQYDSRPPEGANRNDFSFTTSFGWSF